MKQFFLFLLKVIDEITARISIHSGDVVVDLTPGKREGKDENKR